VLWLRNQDIDDDVYELEQRRNRFSIIFEGNLAGMDRVIASDPNNI